MKPPVAEALPAVRAELRAVREALADLGARADRAEARRELVSPMLDPLGSDLLERERRLKAALAVLEGADLTRGAGRAA